MIPNNIPQNEDQLNTKPAGDQGHGPSGLAMAVREARKTRGDHLERLQAQIDKLTQVVEGSPSALIIADCGV